MFTFRQSLAVLAALCTSLCAASPSRAASTVLSATWTNNAIGADGTHVYQVTAAGPHALKLCDGLGAATSCGGAADLANGNCFVATAYKGTQESADSVKACVPVTLNSPTSVVIVVPAASPATPTP